MTTVQPAEFRIDVLQHQFAGLGDALVELDVILLVDRDLDVAVEGTRLEVALETDRLLELHQAVEVGDAVLDKLLEALALVDEALVDPTAHGVAGLVELAHVTGRDGVALEVDPEFILLGCHVGGSLLFG